MGQHYVPQHHLRQFATPSDPGQNMGVRQSVLASAELLPIRNVAQSSDFYMEADERALSEKIEGPAQRAARSTADVVNRSTIQVGKRWHSILGLDDQEGAAF